MVLREFLDYNAQAFYRALDDGRLYPDAWIHLATWWALSGRCPDWPPRRDCVRAEEG